MSSLSAHCLSFSRSLSAVASGGESARIMLAFKAVPIQMRNTFGDSKAKETEGNHNIHSIDSLYSFLFRFIRICPCSR